MKTYKVAILTQPLGHNYGGLLQAYALQRYLEKIGCEVETLDRRQPISATQSLKNFTLNIVRLLLGHINSIPTAKRREFLLRHLTNFRNYQLKMSPEITTERALRSYFRHNEFDAVIVGSDQVWRPRYSPSILNFFLDFLEDIENPPKRISYAASFGVDNWEYPQELTARCRELVSKFDAVSVREESAVGLCRGKLNISATCVVDPTMLLEPSDYNVLTDRRLKIKRSGRIRLLSFILDPHTEKRSIEGSITTALDSDLFSISPAFSDERTHYRQFSLPSVEKWLQAFQSSDFVVTDSFHGTVFSIIFNKPFVSITNSLRGSARFQSLLSQLGLLDRLITTKDEVTTDIIHEEIDWQSVNFRRQLLASEGKKFIKTHLFSE